MKDDVDCGYYYDDDDDDDDDNDDDDKVNGDNVQYEVGDGDKYDIDSGH